LITPTVEICIQQLGRADEMAFTARRSYASAVLGVIILSFCPSDREPTGDIFIPHEREILIVKCDFSYSCAAADKISTDFRARAVFLWQLSYLLILVKADRRCTAITDLFYFSVFEKVVPSVLCLQCFDTFGWAAGRASGL